MALARSRSPARQVHGRTSSRNSRPAVADGASQGSSAASFLSTASLPPRRRGDKGLLITTGTFTADAKKEATRDGAPPVDLIDGDRLCELLKKYDLGVHTRQVEEVDVDGSFFAEL